MDTQLTVRERKTLAQCDETIEKGEAIFIAVGKALATVRDQQLWRESYASFEEYCRIRHSKSARLAYYQINSAKAVEDIQEVRTMVHGSNLSSQDDDPISQVNERVAREVAKAETPQARADVWVKSVETAPKDKDGKPRITASHVKKVRQELIPPDGANSHETNGETVEQEDWQVFADLHKQALNHLTQARKAIREIERHGEAAEYLAHVVTRIETDYQQLRSTIRGNTPIGVKDGEIQTQLQKRG